MHGMDDNKGGSVRAEPSPRVASPGAAVTPPGRLPSADSLRTFLTRHCKQDAGFIESVLGQDWREGRSRIRSYSVFHWNEGPDPEIGFGGVV
jgi:hypothetical protein